MIIAHFTPFTTPTSTHGNTHSKHLKTCFECYFSPNALKLDNPTTNLKSYKSHMHAYKLQHRLSLRQQ